MSFDYGQYLNHKLDDAWELMGIDELNGEGIISLVDSFCYIPNPTYKTLLGIYTFIPSALCRILPILCIQGLSGTGKSMMGLLASNIRRSPIMTSADTFASIRNALNLQKFGEDGEGLEDNAILIWDDIDPKVFDVKPDIYRMLKVGYDRSTANLSIAGKEGKNITVNVFCPKIFSTIHTSIYNSPECSELARRLLIIPSSKCPLSVAENLLDMNAFNFHSLTTAYYDFWHTPDNCIKYSETVAHLRKHKPRKFELDVWKLMTNFLATGIVLEFFEDYNDAHDWLETYVTLHREIIENEGDNLYLALKEFTQDLYELQIEKNPEKVIKELKIKPDMVKRQVKEWEEKSLLNRKPDWEKNIIPTMKKLGFELSWAKKGLFVKQFKED